MEQVLTSVRQRLQEDVYRWEEFVNRGKEVNIACEKLEHAWQGELLTPLLLFQGVHGIGKSWLLSHLSVTFSFSARKWKEAGWASLSIKVALSKYAGEKDLRPVLLALAQGLDSQLSAVATDLGVAERLQDLLHLLSNELSSLQIRDGIDELIGLLEKLCQEKIVPVLLFDAAEQFPSALLDDLVGWLIRPLIHRQDILIVFAAQGDFEFSLFDVNARSTIYRLEPFGIQDVKAKVERRGNDLSPAVVESFSYGHPQTIEAICEAVQAIAEREGVSSKELVLQTKAREMVDILDGVIVKDVFMQGLDDEQQQLLEAICILRRFNVQPLKRFATRFVEHEARDYGKEGYVFFSLRLGEFVGANLAEWWRAERGYVLDSVVRQIMSHNLQVKDPNSFRARHQEAAEMYGQTISEAPEQGSLVILERIYHLACLARMDGESILKLKEIVGHEMDRVLDRDRLEIDQVKNLENELQQDVELEYVLGKEVYDMLNRRLEEFEQRLD